MKLSKQIRYPAVFGLFIAILMGITVIGLRCAGRLQFLELVVYDYYIQYHPRIRTPDPRILLVTISDTDIREYGWPIPDAKIAQLFEIILKYSPKVMGLDIYRDIPVPPPGNEELKAIFSDNQKIVTVTKVGDEKSPGVPPPYMVKADSFLVGANDIPIDPEGIVRRGLLFLDDGKTNYYSFPLLMAMLYLQADGIVPQPDASNPDFMRLGKTTFIPLKSNDGGYIGMDAGGYQFLLDFSGAWQSFQSFSISEVLSGKIEPEEFENKIVIIGSTAESLRDFFFIPFVRSGKFGQTIPGLEIHASIVSQLLRAALDGRKPMRFIGEMYEWGWIILWSAAGYLLGLSFSSFRLFLISNFCTGFIMLVLTFILFMEGFWLPVVPPSLAGLISAVMVMTYSSYQEKKQRIILMQIFSSHVSPKVAEAIWEQREQFVENGRPRSQKLTATVLFTDLKGFTSVSEGLDPETLMDWLNEYMAAMIKVIVAHGGVINKFIGDAIMVIFGVPVARNTEAEISKDALNAVKCAVAMGERLEKLNESWRAQGRPEIKMRVGICTGPLVVGCLGSIQRQEYTVIGDTVNTASRLESFDKNLDPENTCRILIGETTCQCLGDQCEITPLTSVSLKGKEQKVMVYQVNR
jgi:adenylate cyclase